jgi:hypothetical protein
VVSILKELIDQLKADQQADDLDFVKRMVTLNSEVDSLDRSLENLTMERTSTNTFL